MVISQKRTSSHHFLQGERSFHPRTSTSDSLDLDRDFQRGVCLSISYDLSCEPVAEMRVLETKREEGGEEEQGLTKVKTKQVRAVNLRIVSSDDEEEVSDH